MDIVDWDYLHRLEIEDDVNGVACYYCGNGSRTNSPCSCKYGYDEDEPPDNTYNRSTDFL